MTSKFTVHLDRTRIAVADTEASARRWVHAQDEDNDRFALYEYLGGNPSRRESYREIWIG
jgi:hypothetical protein